MTKAEVVVRLEHELRYAVAKRDIYQSKDGAAAFALEQLYEGRVAGMRLALAYIELMEDIGSK